MEIGGLYLLAHYPIWVIVAFLVALLHVVPFVGRDYFEGMPYQVSYSAQIGDAGLLIVILIAATILQREGTFIPAWLVSTPLHVILTIAVFAVGALASIATLKSRSGQLVDVYHDVVIASILMYFAVTCLPVISANGTYVEYWMTVILISVWVMLVLFDLMTHRMNQREWLEEKGVIFDR